MGGKKYNVCMTENKYNIVKICYVKAAVWNENPYGIRKEINWKVWDEVPCYFTFAICTHLSFS